MVQPSNGAEANPNKPTIIVMGSIGHGKSTFLNRLAGQEGVFKAGRSVVSVTTKPACHEMDFFNLIDTPGLNDARIPTADWVSRFNQTPSTKP